MSIFRIFIIASIGLVLVTFIILINILWRNKKGEKEAKNAILGAIASFVGAVANNQHI